ncbi:lysozyme family protein [Scopulibacillus daqui]|nr:lysozyme family protein [Scopulibacillus daqui]
MIVIMAAAIVFSFMGLSLLTSSLVKSRFASFSLHRSFSDMPIEKLVYIFGEENPYFATDLPNSRHLLSLSSGFLEFSPRFSLGDIRSLLGYELPNLTLYDTKNIKFPEESASVIKEKKTAGRHLKISDSELEKVVPLSLKIQDNQKNNLTASTIQWRPLVTKYAEEYGVEHEVPILLAMIQQESGGRLEDVMQSSEAYCGYIGCIKDPKLSIKVGVKTFAERLKEAHGNIKLAVQSYNFGPGFIPYAEKNGGYSNEVAATFSHMMAEKNGWNNYGDIDYVQHVLRYDQG